MLWRQVPRGGVVLHACEKVFQLSVCILLCVVCVCVCVCVCVYVCVSAGAGAAFPLGGVALHGLVRAGDVDGVVRLHSTSSKAKW